MDADMLEMIVLVISLIVILVVLAAVVLLTRKVDDALEQPRDTTEALQQIPQLPAFLDRQFSQSRELQRMELAHQQEAVENLTKQVDSLRLEVNHNLEAVRNENTTSLDRLRADNKKSLDDMRATVDEKLEHTLNERLARSFQRVDERLQQVDRGLGEMQGLAQGVGDLKRVLSNVKTRGILGEVQLGSILREVLAPVQYDENVATVPGSSNRVEFAVRLPGENGEHVWLPIDAKFPGDTYDQLRQASDSGDTEGLERAWKLLETRLCAEAKDIHEKYIAPPATTTFGILFLPFEGLYAEVANRRGLLERLQREYRVNVVGPSTMAALLNSLQMSFQAVAIQQRADEIQQVLTAVKTEFSTYKNTLMRAQKQLGTASKTLDTLVGTRTRAMERKLSRITDPEELPASGKARISDNPRAGHFADLDDEDLNDEDFDS